MAAVLAMERARGEDPSFPSRPTLAVGQAFFAPAHVEVLDPTGWAMPCAALVDLSADVAATRRLFGADAWREGTKRLERLFGRGDFRPPPSGLAKRFPRGRNFLEEGPFLGRLRAVLKADVATSLDDKGTSRGGG